MQIPKHKSCDFEVLLSCMHEKDFSIAYRTKIDSDLLIINQCDEEDYSETEVNGHLWRMISTKERGLSKSRNMAMENARGEIILFADDDETMAHGYEDAIIRAFSELSDATMIAFNVNRINVAMKKTYYHINSVKLSHRLFGAPMTACRLSYIKEANIRMNEMFGSGSDWGGGEDGLFQRDIRRSSLLIYEYPLEIATIDYSNESKWFNGYTPEYFYQQGAYAEHSETSKVKSMLYALYSSFWKLRKETDLSPFQKLKWRRLGKKGWRKNVTYREFVANGYSYEPGYKK